MPTPNHDLIAEVVSQEHERQLRHSDGLDFKASAALAAGGLLAVLNGGSSANVAQDVGLCALAIGTVLALISLIIRPSHSINPNMLRARYADREVEETALRLLDTRCDQYLYAARKLSVKTGFFLGGMMALALGVLALVVGVVFA